MNKRIKRHLALLVLMLCVAALAIGFTGAAVASGDAGINAINRVLEPVIVTGGEVADLAGVPVGELFVYKYVGTTWTQIPSQVDEVNALGDYVTTEDGLLDGNDEIAFMAMDLGDKASATEIWNSGLPVGAVSYEIEVTDPTNPANQGWAYLFQSDTLVHIPTDYVSFNEPLLRITGLNYVMSYSADHPYIDYLAVGGVDVLDRTKLRAYGASVPTLTEDLTGARPRNLIADGPVRVIVQDGHGIAYGSMIVWDAEIYELGEGYDLIRFSADHDPAVNGSTFYSSAAPAGKTVDGSPDTVLPVPVSPWWQLSTSYGTVVHAGDTSQMGGTQVNYYKDDSTIDPADTGDQQSWGDVGVSILNPNPSFVYRWAMYRLPPSLPSVGATYQSYFDNPLEATASRPKFMLYLPLILRNAP